MLLVPRLSALLIKTSLSLRVKASATDPVSFPFLRRLPPLSSPRLRPKSANSIAWRMVLFPLPTSPERRVFPWGKARVCLVKLLMFSKVSVLRIMGVLWLLH